MAMGIKEIKFIALSPTGSGISGGDRIFIELARRWSNKYSLEIITTREGLLMMNSQNLSGKELKINIISNNLPSGFFLKYIYKILLGLKYGLTEHFKYTKETIIYPASDFWMDAFPAILLKIRFPKVKWVATWYQTAPNPFIGYAEGNREEKYRFKAFLYWFSQLPIKPLIANFADFVLVNNEIEKKQFPELNKKNKAVVVLGAVDLSRINSYILRHKSLIKKYDAVFQGRFHPQKGVVELIDIWRKVVDKRPDASLVMIGDGPLMKDVKFKIQDLRLQKNVKLFGYVFDGDEKYKIFSQSKIVVHPAFYDSGGMAAAEAMAFGLPVIGFNLRSYKYYYPKGMVKVEIGDIDKFSMVVLDLLYNKKKRDEIAKEALEMLNQNWSWDKRAAEIHKKII